MKLFQVPRIPLLFLFPVLLLFGAVCFGNQSEPSVIEAAAEGSDFIQWVEFDVPLKAMQKAGQADIDSYGDENHISWIDALACLAAQYGGNWKQYQGSDLDKIIEGLKNGKAPKQLISYNQDVIAYYQEAYQAVLGGFIGNYQSEDSSGVISEQYGVKVFSPLAAGYGYNHYDDFRNSRSYGYSRPHMGNDLLADTGTPIVAVESGVIESLGWNQYGGWRIGIRSLDQKRYYYYAHLQSGHPYVDSLQEGDTVTAGEVIGYVGMTGYSTTEDTNGMTKPHLHFGMQLIFDESQKECDSEIWIDVYDIVNFLHKHRSETVYSQEDGEYYRKYAFSDID